MNGEEMNIDTKFGTRKTIKIRTEMRKFLVETTKCTEVPYYNCYGSMLMSQLDKVNVSWFNLSKLFGLSMINLSNQIRAIPSA